MRKQKDKVLPSGVTPNQAYSFPDRHGGEDCLIGVNRDTVKAMLNDMQEEQAALTDWGVSPDLVPLAKQALKKLRVKEVTLENIWLVFCALIGLLEAESEPESE